MKAWCAYQFDERGRKKDGCEFEQEGNEEETMAMGTETSRRLDKREVSRIVFFWPRYSASNRSIKFLALDNRANITFHRLPFPTFNRDTVSSDESNSLFSGEFLFPRDN